MPISSTILVINGPNLNKLGIREPKIYGDFRQSNSEGELVGWIQELCERVSGVAINAAAYTHTSVALLDALSILDVPVIEVHLSNVFAREAFRHHSYISCAATGVICGFGGKSYLLAIDAIADILDNKNKNSE